jgi:hypothetical protein
VCDCNKRMNEALKEYNTMLVTNLIGPPHALVLTDKIDSKKRGKPMMMFASYCPFCGEKYPRKEGGDAEGE